MAKTIDQQFIEYIAETIVGNPDEVKVERSIDEKGVLLELYVNPDDLGRVIGRRGITAQSMRTLLRALGTKNDARYNLKIIDTAEVEGYESASASDDDDDDDSDAQDESSQEDTSEEEVDESDDTTEEDDDEEEEDDVLSKQRQDIEDLKDELDI